MYKCQGNFSSIHFRLKMKLRRLVSHFTVQRYQFLFINKVISMMISIAKVMEKKEEKTGTIRLNLIGFSSEQCTYNGRIRLK